MRFIQDREPQTVEASVEVGAGLSLVRRVWCSSKLGVEQWRRTTDSVHGTLSKQGECGEMNACLVPAV